MAVQQGKTARSRCGRRGAANPPESSSRTGYRATPHGARHAHKDARRARDLPY